MSNNNNKHLRKEAAVSGTQGRGTGGGGGGVADRSTGNINYGNSDDNSRKNNGQQNRPRSRTPTSGRKGYEEEGGTQSTLRNWMDRGGKTTPPPARDEQEKRARTTGTPMREDEKEGNSRSLGLTGTSDVGKEREENGDVRMRKEGEGEATEESNDEETKTEEEEEDDESARGTKLFHDGNTAAPIASVVGLTPTEQTPKSARFASGTSFTRKKTPDSRTRGNTANPYRKAVTTVNSQPRLRNHNFHTYIRVQINIRGEDNTPAAIVRVLGAFLACIQTRDPTACFSKPLNHRMQIHSEKDFPPDFKDFYDYWSHWEHDASYFLIPVPAIKNGRAFHGTLCLATDWEAKRLLEQCVFSIKDISSKGGTIQAFVKDLQDLRTSRNLILFGVPSNVSYEGVGILLSNVMMDMLPEMVAEDPKRYPKAEFEFVPPFKVSRMYVKNTPYVARDRNDETPTWAKLPLHFEVSTNFKETLEDILFFMVRKRVLNQVFGDYAWILKNCAPSAAGEQIKSEMKNALRTHMAIVLSLGRVQLGGLENPDEIVRLNRGLDVMGERKKAVYMSVRKLMMSVKVNGCRLWQFICPTTNGGWCGYYSCGKLCEHHQNLAESWARSTSATVRFKCVARSVEPEDIHKLLRKSFSLPALRNAEKARYINGVIITDQHASMMEVEQKIRRCKWVDKAYLQDDRRVATKDQHTAAILANDPNAFNFQDGNSVRKPPSISGTTAGDTAAMSMINPETGEAWKEGEREQHLAAAVGAMEQVDNDEGSISEESAAWEDPGVEYEFEGLENMDETKDEEGQDGAVDRRREMTRELEEQLMQALLTSGRVNSGEGLPLGRDVHGLMRAAIEALKDTPRPTGTAGQNQPGEGNTGEDHQDSRMHPGGQGP